MAAGGLFGKPRLTRLVTFAIVMSSLLWVGAAALQAAPHLRRSHPTGGQRHDATCKAADKVNAWRPQATLAVGRSKPGLDPHPSKRKCRLRTPAVHAVL